MKSEDELTQMAKETLDKRAAEQDAELLDRLAAARRKALDAIPLNEQPQNNHSQQKPSKTFAFYFTGAVTASVLAVLLYINMPGSEQTEEAQLVNDFEFLLNEDEALDMLEHDLEFYVWLENQEMEEQI